ncbi:HNH endonuclease [Streptomyces sp. ATE26]|uniref:HNH endonuclease n=1 Tax=Streptomyces sp. ATE26 TaxID=2954237 RepID=UPI002482B44F|nr:HNH endonuclease [Streptomyces sp. ATE26]MDI1454440.1 HNH endonuclease [Streptomyces sp. ATE26]
MSPTDVDVDDFFEFVGNYNSRWTDDRKGIVLAVGNKNAYQVAAYLVDRRRPSLVITFRGEMSEIDRSRIYNYIRDVTDKLETVFTADVQVSWRKRTIRVTRQSSVHWPSGTVNQSIYARSAASAKEWFHCARREMVRLINNPPEQTTSHDVSELYVTRKMISSAPNPVPIVKPRAAKVRPPSAWPIPLTPATPRNHPHDLAAEILSLPAKEASPSTSPDGSKESAGGLPAQRQKICPVCNRPTSAGRIRHQQCERRAIPDQTSKKAPSSPVPLGIEPEACSEYQRLIRKVEQSEKRTYGKRRDTIRRNPLRLDEARRAVLLRCQGRCENPACGGQPNDLTDDGRPILEVDHVQRIAEGGRDHPVQMVALCPNCHAMKERGSNRLALQTSLLEVAAGAHHRWNDHSS